MPGFYDTRHMSTVAGTTRAITESPQSSTPAIKYASPAKEAREIYTHRMTDIAGKEAASVDQDCMASILRRIAARLPRYISVDQVRSLIDQYLPLLGPDDIVDLVTRDFLEYPSTDCEEDSGSDMDLESESEADDLESDNILSATSVTSATTNSPSLNVSGEDVDESLSGSDMDLESESEAADSESDDIPSVTTTTATPARNVSEEDDKEATSCKRDTMEQVEVSRNCASPSAPRKLNLDEDHVDDLHRATPTDSSENGEKREETLKRKLDDDGEQDDEIGLPKRTKRSSDWQHTSGAIFAYCDYDSD